MCCSQCGRKLTDKERADIEMAKLALRRMLWDPDSVLTLIDKGVPIEVLAVIAMGVGPPPKLQ